MKVLIWADQYLDPRLRRRANWFAKEGYDVHLSYLKRADWFASEKDANYPFIDYKDKKELLKFRNNVIYISGIKILIDNFYIIRTLGKSNTIFIEIPDLPLRSSFFIKNAVTSSLLKIIIKLLSKNIIVTSSAFLEKLPSHLNYFLLENIVDYNNAKQLDNIERKLGPRIKIGYIGVIRYMEQLELLLKFVHDNHNDYELHIYGGPVDRLTAIMGDYNKHNNIFIYGAYVFEKDIISIYQNVDITYAVYDASQPNVQLALPNKLYEAALAKTWILVADSTYLGETVDKHQIGIALPFSFKDYFIFEKKLLDFLESIKNNKKEFNKEYAFNLLELSRNQKHDFLNYINETHNNEM